jgi:hypothetical protein
MYKVRPKTKLGVRVNASPSMRHGHVYYESLNFACGASSMTSGQDRRDDVYRTLWTTLVLCQLWLPAGVDVTQGQAHISVG